MLRFRALHIRFLFHITVYWLSARGMEGGTLHLLWHSNHPSRLQRWRWTFPRWQSFRRSRVPSSLSTVLCLDGETRMPLIMIDRVHPLLIFNFSNYLPRRLTYRYFFSIARECEKRAALKTKICSGTSRRILRLWFHWRVDYYGKTKPLSHQYRAFRFFSILCHELQD